MPHLPGVVLGALLPGASAGVAQVWPAPERPAVVVRPVADVSQRVLDDVEAALGRWASDCDMQVWKAASGVDR